MTDKFRQREARERYLARVARARRLKELTEASHSHSSTSRGSSSQSARERRTLSDSSEPSDIEEQHRSSVARSAAPRQVGSAPRTRDPVSRSNGGFLIKKNRAVTVADIERAEQTAKRAKIDKELWYWPLGSVKECRRALSTQPQGSFIVRPWWAGVPGSLVLAVQQVSRGGEKTVGHAPIVKTTSGWSILIGNPRKEYVRKSGVAVVEVLESLYPFVRMKMGLPRPMVSENSVASLESSGSTSDLSQSQDDSSRENSRSASRSASSSHDIFFSIDSDGGTDSFENLPQSDLFRSSDDASWLETLRWGKK